jgi:hypothetical protein
MKTASLLCLLVIVAACSAPAMQVPAGPPLDRHLNAILGAALEGPRRDSILLAPELQARLGSLDSAAWLDSNSWVRKNPHLRSLAGAYWHENQTPLVLTAAPTIPGRIVRLSRLEPPSAHVSPLWITRLSRPVFSAHGDSALVAISTRCGSLCGMDALDLYIWRDGHWVEGANLAGAIY